MPIDSLYCESNPESIKIDMVSIACPEINQSEAYISTVALFILFASTPEQKVFMRLSSVWRDVWAELSDLRKAYHDAKDRDVLRELRSVIEEAEKNKQSSPSNDTEFHGSKSLKDQILVVKSSELQQQHLPALSSNELKAIWVTKERSPSYQQMLLKRMDLPMYRFKQDLLSTIDKRQVVIVCGETGCGKSTQGESPKM